jgi:hypothetical protein
MKRELDGKKACLSSGLETAKDLAYSGMLCLNVVRVIARSEANRWAAQSRRTSASLDRFARQFAASSQ